MWDRVRSATFVPQIHALLEQCASRVLVFAKLIAALDIDGTTGDPTKFQ